MTTKENMRRHMAKHAGERAMRYAAHDAYFSPIYHTLIEKAIRDGVSPKIARHHYEWLTKKNAPAAAGTTSKG